MKINQLFVVLLATILFVECSDYDNDYTEQDIQYSLYSQAFTDMFGDIAPGHTWNTSVQRTLTFNVGLKGTFNLKVYTTSPRLASNESVLLANYENYEGSQSHNITFDCPSGLNTVYAALEFAGTTRYVLQKATFDLNGHASANFGTNGNTRGTILVEEKSGDARVYKSNSTLQFPKEAYIGNGRGFHDIVPEGGSDPDKTHKEGDNTVLEQKGTGNLNNAGISTDFIYFSTGKPYTVYPMFTNTSAGSTLEGNKGKNTISVQWRVSNGEWQEMQPIWEMDDKNSVTCVFKEVGGNIIKFEKGPNVIDTPDWASYNWTDYTYTFTGTDTKSYYFDHVEAQGITIDLPYGYEFRFVLNQTILNSERTETKNKNYFSNSANNDDGDGDGKKDIYFSTFETGYMVNNQPVLFIGMEDWDYGSLGLWDSDRDLNDIVFACVGELPVVVEENTPQYLTAEYTIAYEDLGSSFDFDFNDVVIGVKHTAGQTTADLTLKAVGGTLPVFLKRGNISMFKEGEGRPEDYPMELHKVLDKNQIEPNNLRPINVQGYGNSQTATPTTEYKTVEIEVPTDFSIVKHAGLFKILVLEKGTKWGDKPEEHAAMLSPINPADGNYTYDHNTVMPQSNRGIIPQAIVVGDPKWVWPKELTPINEAYPDFPTWAKKEHSSWYNPIWSGKDGNNAAINDFVHVEIVESDRKTFNIALRMDSSTDEKENGDIVEAFYTISIANLKTQLEKDNFNEGLELAFVITGRENGQNAHVKVYKEGNESNNYEWIEISDDDDEESDGVLFSGNVGNNGNVSSSIGEAQAITIPSEKLRDYNGSIHIQFFRMKGVNQNCHLNSILSIK